MYELVKRSLDVILSFIGLLFLSPLLLLLALGIKLESNGPILFCQKRIGRYKREFYILKFRTMRTDAPKDMPTHLLENPEIYITRIGKILRKTSLDELPQLFNILKGDMSLVGPRPALWNQQDLIRERDKYGANNLPVGLTGWAQINGRDELPIEEKARLDGEYVQRRGFWFDCCCCFATIGMVLQQKGIAEGKAGAEQVKKGRKKF